MLENTKEVLEVLAKDDFFALNDVRFVGGTALSYLINHRLSEDLDFAMLSLQRETIETMMYSYGATLQKHTFNLQDTAANDGENIYDHYIIFTLNGVKVEFFTPPFNIFELDIWNNENTTLYEKSNLKIASLKTIAYMKTTAFWNRKKYRDLFDIYFLINNGYYPTKDFLENYMKYNITYSKKHLLEKIQSKNEFYEKPNDEGIYILVKDSKSYEWYRKKIEDYIYQEYLKELYG